MGSTFWTEQHFRNKCYSFANAYNNLYRYGNYRSLCFNGNSHYYGSTGCNLIGYGKQYPNLCRNKRYVNSCGSQHLYMVTRCSFMIYFKCNSANNNRLYPNRFNF